MGRRFVELFLHHTKKLSYFLGVTRLSLGEKAILTTTPDFVSPPYCQSKLAVLISLSGVWFSRVSTRDTSKFSPQVRAGTTENQLIFIFLLPFFSSWVRAVGSFDRFSVFLLHLSHPSCLSSLPALLYDIVIWSYAFEHFSSLYVRSCSDGN